MMARTPGAEPEGSRIETRECRPQALLHLCLWERPLCAHPRPWSQHKTIPGHRGAILEGSPRYWWKPVTWDRVLGTAERRYESVRFPWIHMLPSRLLAKNAHWIGLRPERPATVCHHPTAEAQKARYL